MSDLRQHVPTSQTVVVLKEQPGQGPYAFGED